jgi:hypothetical protein
MGYTQWVLAQDAEQTFAFVPYRQYSAFHAGHAPLKQVTPGEVRLIEVTLHLESRVATKVRALHFRRFPVLPNGLRDPDAIDRELSLIVSLPCSESRKGTESSAQRFMERQLTAEFRWVPTAAEAQSIADAVNRRARRHLLGSHPIRLLE